MFKFFKEEHSIKETFIYIILRGNFLFLTPSPVCTNCLVQMFFF